MENQSAIEILQFFIMHQLLLFKPLNIWNLGDMIMYNNCKLRSTSSGYEGSTYNFSFTISQFSLYTLSSKLFHFIHFLLSWFTLTFFTFKCLLTHTFSFPFKPILFSIHIQTIWAPYTLSHNQTHTLSNIFTTSSFN